MGRLRWPSQTTFIFAAVGSAVGLGNVWRFPYLAGKYGGGAFLIPYLIMLFVIGIPLLIMEFAIGQRMQLGAIGSFGKIRHRLSSIGFGAVLCGFVVVSYYTVIMAWCFIYLILSFKLGWGDNTEVFFSRNILQLSSGPLEMGQPVTRIVYALVAVWLCVYFSVWKGIRSVGKVVMVTMPLPAILLIILAIRGITLPGSMDGLRFYLKPDFNLLLESEVWSAAASQIFFTLSIAFGIMIAYASYRHETSDIAKSAFVTAITNCSISIVAGFAVFTTLGYMASRAGTSVSEFAAKGVGLAFIVFPKALSLIPGAPFFSVLFFIMLLTLAIDSAFSLVEAVTTVISDKYPHVRREDLTMYVCAFGLISGIIYTTFAGLHYLDIVDHFITTFGLVFVGLLEVLAIGWLYGSEKLRRYINDVSDLKIGRWWSISIKYVIPVVLTILLVTGLVQEVKEPYGPSEGESYPRWALQIFGWGMLGVVLLISYLLAHFTKEE